MDDVKGSWTARPSQIAYSFLIPVNAHQARPEGGNVLDGYQPNDEGNGKKPKYGKGPNKFLLEIDNVWCTCTYQTPRLTTQSLINCDTLQIIHVAGRYQIPNVPPHEMYFSLVSSNLCLHIEEP